MKKEIPTLEEVKEHFKNAKEVKCLYNKNIADITKNITESIFTFPGNKGNDFWIKISTHKGGEVLLWSIEDGFAKIISYKEEKIMKKEIPTLEEVKEYFKNAKEVKCLCNGNIIDITQNITKDFNESFYRFWIEISNHKGKQVLLWKEEKGYAEIISYKEIKPKFKHLEEIEVADNELYYNQKALFIGYSKDGSVIAELKYGSFFKWKYARKINPKKIQAIEYIEKVMLENNIKIEELKQK
jgi:hypothetical protein